MNNDNNGYLNKNRRDHQGGYAGYNCCLLFGTLIWFVVVLIWHVAQSQFVIQ